ncbi:hypothetical protein HJC23_014040 [Cyclotella cryptica]|uniref:Uncharacterized protein n=1 Tax=Cyclotella cryptica TaxID=29204 RepID=A0ABD3QT82_9STRA
MHHKIMSKNSAHRFGLIAFVTTVLSARITQAANACVNAKINEFEPNPSGTDASIVDVELVCADADKGNGTTFSGWLLSIESDSGSSAGTVDRAAQISGTFDSSGILLVSIPDLENPSFTFVLAEDFTGTLGSTDIDTDNNGVVDDISTFINIYDAIGITDTSSSAEPLYGSQLGGTDLPFTGASEGSEPRLVYRDGINVGIFYILQDPDYGVIKSVENGVATDLTPEDFIGQDPLIASFGLVNPSTSLTAPTPSPLPPVDIKIHIVQGDGEMSPLLGSLVSVTAVVIGDFQDGDLDEKRNLKGFFLQEEDAEADGNPETSEGIFIYDPAFLVDVNIGDLVKVSGTVDEYYGETQIKDVTSVVILSSGNTLPTPATISLPTINTTMSKDGKIQPDLEAYEGMLVTFQDTLVVTEMYNLVRFNEIKLVQGTRPFTFTQKNVPNVTGYQAHEKELGARRITYDDGLAQQNKLICNLDGFGDNGYCQTGSFNTATGIRMGDTVSGLSGVLYYKWAGASASDATWRVTSIQDGSVNFVKSNPRPLAPPSFGSSLKLVSGNVLNFFLTLDNGSTTALGLQPRGADNQEEFLRQKTKLVTALLELDPDILGMLELENEFLPGSNTNALEYLVQEMNAVAGAGTFEWVNPGAEHVDSSDAISNGFLYKTSSIEGIVGSVTVLRDEDLSGIGVDDSQPIFNGPDTNRASVAASFKGGSGTGENADKGDGAGNWNAIRLKAAEAVHTWIETDPTGVMCTMKVLMGDMNAYAMEDPIKYFESVGYIDVDRHFNGDDAYSYVFDGQIGTLDYVLVNAAFLPYLTGASSWHVNSDEASALDYNTDFGRDLLIFDGDFAYRFSDHDSMVVGFALVTPAPAISASVSPSKSPIASTNSSCLPQARKVKLQSLTGAAIQVFEVNVYSTSSDVAAGKFTTQSSVYNDMARFAADKAVDGKSYTFSHTKGADKVSWWEVDLGELFPIESVKILNRWCRDPSDLANCLDRLSHSALVLFDDKGEWVSTTLLGSMSGVDTFEHQFTRSSEYCTGA